MKEWEDDKWQRDYDKTAEGMGIPKPKPKPKIKLKIKLPWWMSWTTGYDYHLSVFAKLTITLAIVVPITLCCMQLWGWSGETVWGTFDGRITVTTPYGTTHVYGDLFDDVKAGAEIPMQVRRNLIRNPKPWKAINPSNRPRGMRVDEEMVWEMKKND